MRRKDREVTDFSEIIKIMKNCDVCRLALNDDGFPYILPLNFGMAVNEDKITLYFHSALEGYKVGLIQKDNRAIKNKKVTKLLDIKIEDGNFDNSNNLEHYLNTDVRNNNKNTKRQLFRSPIVKKIDFMKNNFDNDNY